MSLPLPKPLSVLEDGFLRYKLTDFHCLSCQVFLRTFSFDVVLKSCGFLLKTADCYLKNSRVIDTAAIWTALGPYCHDIRLIFSSYYMTSSVSGQDEPNRALWLATRAGKMERYCPLGISLLVPQDQRSFFGVLSHIINPLLTKIVRSRWLDIGLVLFLRVYGPRLRLGP